MDTKTCKFVLLTIREMSNEKAQFRTIIVFTARCYKYNAIIWTNLCMWLFENILPCQNEFVVYGKKNFLRKYIYL